MAEPSGASTTCECSEVYPCPAKPVPGQPMCAFCLSGHQPQGEEPEQVQP